MKKTKKQKNKYYKEETLEEVKDKEINVILEAENIDKEKCENEEIDNLIDLLENQEEIYGELEG